VLNCAYCDKPCQQTREHVVPDWYNDTPGEAETFSARAPFTHLKGDLIVRDVCSKCNSGVLSSLDGYGKELYDRYFAPPIYSGETVTFDYDGDRLLRWLLKVSYNSARAQNADVRVLREYRKVMLGESPFPDRIRCWLHLVTATCFDPNVGIARPARRDEQGHPNVDEPLWFRVGQFRLPSYPALFLVQRTVLINSFAFTLLIARVDSDWPSPEFDQWIKVFASGYSQAKPIMPSVGSLTTTAEGDHAAASMSFSLASYPTRYLEEPNPYVEGVLKGNLEAFLLHISRELIDIGNTTPIAEILSDMVSSREKALAFRQRVAVLVDGFDDDPKGLWQFPTVRQFFRRLFVECPFVMLVAHPDGGLLKVFAACWLYEDDLTEEIEQQRMAEFLNTAFVGLNGLNHTLALSEEQNREICMAASRVLFGETPPV
jgi:hypothetical protein